MSDGGRGSLLYRVSLFPGISKLNIGIDAKPIVLRLPFSVKS